MSRTSNIIYYHSKKTFTKVTKKNYDKIIYIITFFKFVKVTNFSDDHLIYDYDPIACDYCLIVTNFANAIMSYILKMFQCNFVWYKIFTK